MPKRRSSAASNAGGAAGGAGIGAGGGAAGAGPPAGGPAVPEFFAGPYEVESYSPTRRRTETVRVTFVSPNEADVASDSGNTYRVTRDPEGRANCTCMDFRVRGRERPCRHVLGFEAALSGRRMAAVAPEPASRPTDRRAFDASRLAEEAQRRREEAAAAAQVAAAPLRDHEVSLADDAAFQELLARASRGDLPYEYENVLDGSDNTFGIEIEFEGGDRRAIAQELYERGYVPEPRQGAYHSVRRPGMWSFESDGSLNSGGEIVSPVFRDTPEAWRQIEEVCEIVRRHGGRATSRCGGHVHIGNVPLDHDPASWQRLTDICRRNEDLIYRIAAGGESGGAHRGTHYATPLTRVTGELERAGHYASVNGRQHTVEFRYFNGTLDPRQWQTNVRLAHGLVRAAGNPSTRLPEYRRPLGSVARSGDENHSLVRNFLDTVFTRARDKVAVLWLYATSRWQTMTA